MHSPTTTTMLRGHHVLVARHILLAVLALLTALIAVGPAHALPTLQPADTPTPPPGPGGLTLAPALLATPDCNPDGFYYKMVHTTAPEGSIYQAQWREAPNGPVKNAPFNQASGFIASGQGDFQVRGVIVHQGEPFHSYDWKDVTVFCPGIKLPPSERTEVTIDVAPQCDPTEGITYGIQVVDAPNGDQAHKAQWRELGGQVASVEGTNGTIATGQGTFEVRGVVYVQNQPGFFASDWTQVTVDCPDEPGDDPGDEPEDEPEDDPSDEPHEQPDDEPEVEVLEDTFDAPRLATPNFTG